MQAMRFTVWLVVVMVVVFVLALRVASRATGVMGRFSPRL
jgi:hypothetical protein